MTLKQAPAVPSHTAGAVIAPTAESRPSLPPFTLETAIEKVRAAEDGWNSHDPERVSLAYSGAGGATGPSFSPAEPRS